MNTAFFILGYLSAFIAVHNEVNAQVPFSLDQLNLAISL
jgi:hypothetical protein